MNKNELFVYGSLGISFVLLLFASQFQPIAILSIIFAGVSYLFYKWGRLYVPFLTQLKKNIKSKYVFDISPSEDAVVKKEGDEYIATVFLNLDVYETMTNKDEDEIKEYGSYFERTISSIRDPIKITAMIYERNMNRYIHDIQNMKAAVEDKIAKEQEKKNVDERKIEILEREKLMWERRLDSIYKSESKPRAITYFAAVSAKGASIDGAISAAKNKAREIKATFSGGMSMTVDALAHNRMNACFDWEFMKPEW